MATGISLSGLASGLDTNTMITQLMSIEQTKLQKIQYRQDRASAKKDNLNDIATKLSALKTAADALKSTADKTWDQSQVVESSDASKVVAAKIAGTGIGGHTIKVDRLASSAQLGYAMSGTLTTFAAGKLTIYSGSDPAAADVKTVTVDIKDGATLSDVATSINAATKSPVSAAVITDADGKQRLVLSSKTTGSAGGFTVDASQLGNGELTADPAYTRAGNTLDAQYEIDGSGQVLTSTSNVIENAIPGVRLTLKGVTASPVTVTASAPDVDRNAIKTKIKAFVDAYNTLLTSIDQKVSDKPIVNPTSDADAQRGSLYGDGGLTSLASQMRALASQTLDGLSGVVDLGDLGISVPKATGGSSTDDAKLGKLTVDDDLLTEALDNDWTKVSGFFDAFSAKVDGFVRGYTGTGKGIIDGRLQSADADIKSFDDQIDTMNTRMNGEETRLRAQFAAMESALAKSQAQGSWLTAQIAKL